MESDQLTQIFDNFVGNREAVGRIASHLDKVIQALLSSDRGVDLENKDGFTDKPADRQISTIRTTYPDEHGSTSQLVLEVFAEGRLQIDAAWYDRSPVEPEHREERIIWFQPNDSASQIASRALSAIVDINENAVTEAFHLFVADRLGGRVTPPSPKT